MDIAAWLRGLGLERYEQAFREHEIDAEILPKLTADDLKDIGVTAVGHRRKLLEAITALVAEPSRFVESEPSAAAARTGTVAGPTKSEAERRQLTVMFADLVGSTELSAQLDPEDMGEVIKAYQDCCAEIIKRWKGHVAKYMGDGVLVYFGWPQAHEDDAERAVRAGLEITAAVSELKPKAEIDLKARVGVATGLVMVGDLVGDDEAQERAVVGETPNLAARLQGLAEPGRLVIAPSTRSLLGGLFELADLGVHDVKGFTKPIHAWWVLGESAAESRFEAMHDQSLTPLVGREHEIALLLERFERARDGEGQVVLLSGEPGIGKSRVVRALRERLADTPYTPVSHYCSPYQTNSALYPVIGLLERAAGFARNDLPETKLDKLEQLLAASTSNVSEVAPLLAALLSIPVDGRHTSLELTPQRQKQRTLEVLVDQLAGLAARQPTLAVYEDVHWVDPSTVELLDLVIERAQGLPVLVLITFRPEFSPPWSGHAHVMQLSLSRLTRRHGEALVARVTDGKALPAEILDQILAHTDGVPLFVEELTKTMLESGLLEDVGDHYELSGLLPSLAIPATLQDSLMARLDRLGLVKEIAQIGAVFGREFSHELLLAVASLPNDELAAALDQLVAAELVFRRGVPPDTVYMFKHALVRDAAYQSLLKGRRKDLHGRIAEVLEAAGQNAGEIEPQLLAYHFTHAGLIEKAVHYWQDAGERAVRGSANAEAVEHITTGLKLIETWPETAERDQQELALRTALAPALTALRGYAAPDVEAVYARIRTLCQRVEDVPQLATALRGLWFFHNTQADFPAARELGEQLVRLAERTRSSADRLEAYRAVGVTQFHAGAFTDAHGHLAEGIALYDRQQHHAHALYGQQDPCVGCCSIDAHALWFLGHPSQASARIEQAVGLAQELSHPFSLTYVLTHAAYLHQCRRDVQRCLAVVEEAIALANKHSFKWWINLGTIMRGWALTLQGEYDTGIHQLRQGLEACETWRSRFLCLLAEAHGYNGQPEVGLEVLVEAFAHVNDTDERFYEAELYRVQGELLLRQGQSNAAAAAESCLRRSLEVARAQKAKSWELRTATSLARLWRDQDQPHQARDLLAPVYGWFTEGFDTDDLQDAKALLDELA